MTDPARTAAIVLAAGRASRFGSPKALAPLDGRPLLGHVLDAVAGLGLASTVVVLGHAADEIERAIAWRGERRVRNPDPDRGLASSLRLGLATVAADPAVEAAIVLLADQPRVRSDAIRAILAADLPPGRSIVVPRYTGGGGANPALVLRAAWPLADGLAGDRGFGPLIAAHPELVLEVPVASANPDVDTPADLAALAEPAPEDSPG